MDPYTPCPGGLDKKVKFCCADLIPELEKLQRMLDGEQRRSCLEHIAKLGSKFQDRACILAYKAMAENHVGQAETAEATLRRFLEVHPGNPIALAEYALVELGRKNVRAAVDRLQQALVVCQKKMPGPVYQVIGAVATALMFDGHPLAARAHFLLQAGLAGDRDPQPATILARMDADPNLSLVQKADPALMFDCPPEAPYKPALDEANRLAGHGAWRAAADKLVAAMASFGDVPALWWNLATLRSYLGDSRAAVSAFQRFASLNVPLHEAVDAEVFALLLRDPQDRDLVEVLRVTLPVRDIEQLHPQLLSGRSTPRMPVDPAELAREDHPPPRDMFWLLDRPLAESSAGLTRENASRVIAELHLYGRETDREPRLEVIVARPEEPAARAVLAEVAEDLVGEPTATEVAAQRSAADKALSWHWRLPDDTPPEIRKRLYTEERRELLMSRWPQIPSRALGDQKPADLAANPKNHPRLLAQILVMELSEPRGAEPFDYDEMRRSLGLPTTADLDATRLDVDRLAIWHYPSLAADKLTDEQLEDCYNTALNCRAHAAILKLGQELLNRPSLAAQVSPAAIYADMAAGMAESEALALLEKAVVVAQERNESPAYFYLRMLPLRIIRGEQDEFNRLMAQLKAHLHEPGVSESLYSMLARFGLIGPMPGRGGEAADAERLDLTASGAAVAPPGGLWGPQGATATPVAPAAEKKSSLWLPGMD
jgi:tetratricopeptide (TPR) repeat protein